MNLEHAHPDDSRATAAIRITLDPADQDELARGNELILERAIFGIDLEVVGGAGRPKGRVRHRGPEPEPVTAGAWESDQP